MGVFITFCGLRFVKFEDSRSIGHQFRGAIRRGPQRTPFLTASLNMRILLAIHNAYADATSGAAHSMRVLMQ